MTDELAQYQTDRPAWLKEASPKMAAMIQKLCDANVPQTWKLMSRDFQTAVWKHLDETQRARVRALRGNG